MMRLRLHTPVRAASDVRSFDVPGSRRELTAADVHRFLLLFMADSVRFGAVRLASRRYIIKVGHEIPEIETTLTTTPDYLIVEKG